MHTEYWWGNHWKTEKDMGGWHLDKNETRRMMELTRDRMQRQALVLAVLNFRLCCCSAGSE
jgi:hypothetical protein